jgi:chromosome partitioning protein
MLERQRRPGWFVINQAPARRSGQEAPGVRRAVDILESYGLPVAPIGLRARAVYQAAVAQGLAAHELDPDSTAAREIAALWAVVAAALWPKAAALSSVIRVPPPAAIHRFATPQAANSAAPSA